MSLKVTGLYGGIRFNKKVAKTSEYVNIHEGIVKDTVSLMRRYAAVDKGEMSNSIKYVKMGVAGFKIIVGVPWAIYQEYGTMYMKVGTPESPKAVTSTSGKPAFRPFMRPALFFMNEAFSDRIKRLFIGFNK